MSSGGSTSDARLMATAADILAAASLSGAGGAGGLSIVTGEGGPASHTYKRVGRGVGLKCLPAVVHFGGYKAGAVHTTTLNVLNASDHSQRITILPPTTPYFKCNFTKKHGLLAPGMTEEITIEFCPTEWRYYYDCIRVRGDKENILVPIHGYPVANEVVFPRRIDFGVCPLAETATRRVALQCKVPIQFEFELKVTGFSSDFQVYPMSGIIPANGQTIITIDYNPVKMVVSRMELEIHVSQFAFEPFKCEIIGSAAAGAVQRQRLEEVPSPETLRQEASAVISPPRGIGSGAVHDAGVEAVLAATRARTLKVSQKMGGTTAATPPRPPEPQDTIMDGVRIPPDLSGTFQTNFVLTQQKGKMKPKDLAAAIRAQNEQRAAQAAAQELIRARQGGTMTRAAAGPGLSLEAMIAEEQGTDLASLLNDTQAPATTDVIEEVPEVETPPATTPGDARRLREMVFLQDVAEIDKAERAREFQSQREWLGEKDMTSDEIERILVVRLDTEKEAALKQRAKDRRRFTSVSQGAHQVIPARAVAVVGAPIAQQPNFDPYVSNEWGKRLGALKRLRHLVTKSIVRQRVTRRVAAIKAGMEAAVAKGGKAALKELVERDFRAAQSGTAVAAKVEGVVGTVPTEAEKAAAAKPQFRISALNIDRITFPTVPASAGADAGKAKAVSVVTPDDFQELTTLKLAQVPEAAVMGYTEVDIPAYPHHIPVELDRTLRQGAPQESRIRHTVDDIAPEITATLQLALPARITEPAPLLASLDGLLPDPGVRLYQPLYTTTEASFDYILQPEVAEPFSLAPPYDVSDVPVEVLPASGTGEDDDQVLSKASLTNDAPPVRDLNGLIMTVGQVGSVDPTTASLRALMPVASLSAVWRPRRERPVPDWVSANNWVAPRGPTLLRGPRKEDLLSDDSESDDESDSPSARPTFAMAQKLFAPEDIKPAAAPAPAPAPGPPLKGAAAKEAAAKEAAAREAAAKEAAAREAAAKEAAAKAAESGGKSEIPRDRARLALAARERAIAEAAANWLDDRMRELSKHIIDPRHQFSYNAIPDLSH